MLSISLTISYQGLTFVFCVATIPFAKDAQAVARHNVTLTSQGIYQGTIYVLVFVPRTTSQPIDENSAGPFGVLDPRSLTERTLYTICVYFAFSKSFLHVVLTVWIVHEFQNWICAKQLRSFGVQHLMWSWATLTLQVEHANHFFFHSRKLPQILLC